MPGSDLFGDEGAGRDGDEVGLDGDGLLEGEPLLRSLRYQFSISAPRKRQTVRPILKFSNHTMST